MNERALRVLEYNKIKESLQECASTAPGKELANALQPLTDAVQVEFLQSATAEGEYVYRMKGGAPFGGIHDIRETVKRAGIGAGLDAFNLLDIADTLAGGRRLKKFIEDLNEVSGQLSIMISFAETIYDGRKIEESIRMAIDDAGEVVDSASPELRRIRTEMRTAKARVKEKLDSMLRSPDVQKMLQDPIITIRNDRYCLPVKSEYRGAFGGFIHDQSSSGATLFIEPASVLNLGNEIRDLELKEKREIDKILQALSTEVGEHAEELIQNAIALAELDFIMAKAIYARKLKATRPELNHQGHIHLKKARHPLIPYEKAVPIDVRLGEDFSLLVITGPNTGGKTVTLKTIGLLSLMAMSGLQVPAEEGSRLSTFEDVFADIGDEQSIEQSLSTFSSHMTNIISILEQANFRSLVLVDELGAGTDPTEGAALAMAILDSLVERGSLTAATTHYSELKAYAYQNEHAINASVEFDVESLRPTYRLLVGVPGKSNAFAISKRLGLSEDLINKAQSKLITSDVEAESLIRSLEETQLQAERDRLAAKELRVKWDEANVRLQEDREKWLASQDKVNEQAEEKARSIVSKAMREADEILSELRELRLNQETAFKEHQLIEMRKKLEQAAPTRRERRAQRKALEAKELKPGDEVTVLTVGQKGTVLDVQGEEVLVQIGIMKTKVRVQQLEKQLVVSSGKEDRSKSSGTALVKRAENSRDTVQMELDLRGERVEQALAEIDRYLDRSVLSGFSRVSIIHGKGTGQLRNAVQEFLRSHPQVASFRYGVHGEGGDGVTIVTLQ